MKQEIEFEIDEDKLAKSIRKFKQLDEDDGDMEDYLFQQEDDGITVRAYPSGKEGEYLEYPVAKIEVSVEISSDAEWYDESLEYGMTQNLRNGNHTVYEALADLIEGAIEKAGLRNPSLVGQDGVLFETSLEVNQ